MQLAILVGANPKIANDSARVRLHKGNWKLMYEGLKDSILILHTLAPNAPHSEDTHISYEICGDSSPLELYLSTTTMLYFEWKYRGTEKAISINAHIDRV